MLGNLALILVNRSSSRSLAHAFTRPNAALWWVVGGALAFLVVTLYVPAVRAVFRFSILHPLDIGAVPRGHGRVRRRLRMGEAGADGIPACRRPMSGQSRRVGLASESR